MCFRFYKYVRQIVVQIANISESDLQNLWSNPWNRAHSVLTCLSPPPNLLHDEWISAHLSQLNYSITNEDIEAVPSDEDFDAGTFDAGDYEMGTSEASSAVEEFPLFANEDLLKRCEKAQNKDLKITKVYF